MEVISKSILNRKDRTKKIRLKDGSEKQIKIAGGNVYRIRYRDDGGKERSEERGPFTSPRKAEKARDAALAELIKTSGHIRDGEKMTFDDLAEECEREIYVERKSTSTKYIIKTLRSYFGNRRIKTINRASIKAYIEWRSKQNIKTAKHGSLQRTIKRSTIDKELRIMRSMIYHAIDQGWLIENPFKHTKKMTPLIRVAKGERSRVLEIDEEPLLLAACTMQVKSIRYGRPGKECKMRKRLVGNFMLKAIVLLGLDAGMRRNEILQIKYQDVDEVNRVVRIPAENTKTNTARTVPLSDRAKVELRRVLHRHRKLRRLNGLPPPKGGDYVFPIEWIAKAFNAAVLRAGISGLTFHDLRRTFTTRQIAAGTNLGMIAAATGHKDLKVLQEHYNKVGTFEMGQLATQIDAANQERIEGIQQAGESNFVN